MLKWSGDNALTMVQNQSSIVILTSIPSPYQVELFDALTAEGMNVTVIYSDAQMTGRQWLRPVCRHQHFILDSASMPRAARLVLDANLVVFGGYQQCLLYRLLKLRHNSGLPWAFWGERPGFKFIGPMGRIFRAATQWRIRSAKVPVWGIGGWAVEGYRQEMGTDRLYLNVPYFSDLSPYLAIARCAHAQPAPVRFLYSGSLIKRKGVDLIAEAFVELVKNGDDAQLCFLGEGALKETIVQKTREVSDRIQFLGFRQWHDLPAIYAQHDIMCAPSRYDGWGLIVPEGMASGMPVIASDTMGSVRDLMTSESGWIVRAGDGQELLSAMQSAMATSPAQRFEMGRRNRMAVKKQHVESGVTCVRLAVEQTLSAFREIAVMRQTR